MLNLRIGVSAMLSGNRLASGVAVGLVAGVVAAVDGPLAHAFDWLWFAQRVPYALSALALVTVLLAALSVVLVLRNATWLWDRQFLLATVMIVCSIHLMAVDAGPINPLNIMIVVMCTLWLLHRCVDYTAPWSPSGFFHLTALFMACVLASALNHGIPEVIRGWITIVPKLVLVLVLVDVLNSRRHVDLAVNTLIVSSAVAALVGMVQIGLYWTYGWDLTLMDEDAPRFVFLAGLPILRASGLQETPHSYAQPLAIAVLMALYLASAVGSRRRIWLCCAALATLVAVLLSVARGQWIGIIAGLALLPLLARPRSIFTLWVPIGFILLLAGLVSGALPWAVGVVGGITTGSDTVRLELLGAGIRAMLDHPLNGVGIGNFGSYLPTYDRYPVHNAVIQIASELGAIGCLVYVTIFAWVAARLVSGIRAATEAHARDQLKALLVGFAGLVVSIQFEPSGYSEFVWLFLVLADSAVRVAMREANRQTIMTLQQQDSGQRTRLLRAGL